MTIGCGMGDHAVARRRPGWVMLLAVLTVVCTVLGAPGVVWAQDDSADGTAVGDTLTSDEQAPPATGMSSAMSQAVKESQDPNNTSNVNAFALTSFFGKLTNTPKAGAKANVRQNTYYGELVSMLNMRSAATFSNTAKWSYDEFRSQDKNIESRSNGATYNLGQTLPLIMRLDGSRDWSQDKTVNTAGFSNLFAQDRKSLRLSGSKTKAQTGVFTHSLKFGGSFDDRQSENQGTANNSREGTMNAGLQTGWMIRPGLVLAGRIYGTTTSGEKMLGAEESPSSAHGDTLGLGLYYDHGFGNGRVSISRANFEKKYLDFKKNSNGLIDTVGVAEDLKVVDELETRDATSIEFESSFSIGPVAFKGAMSRTLDDLDYAVSGQGLKERQLDDVNLSTGVKVGADSLSIGYEYTWKWDDQRLQGATINRGRQYNKNRELELIWTRPLFSATDFRLRYYQGLSQDIAQFEHNQNDKDRLQNDFSVQVDRMWPSVFRARMAYVYRQTNDISIRETRSSNNNIKDSYEITPSYTWYMTPWLTWDQNYRVFIQYTDYDYSHLESVSREDNYNKRGNLTTKVTIRPTKRLEVVLRHDYNKKFNASRSGQDVSGSTVYSRDLNQAISKLDMALSFKVTTGVTMEAATYRTRDDRESFGRSTKETSEYSGELWIGTKVDQTWRNGITLAALVKKYNAFGPSVSKSSANYWEADVWLKWEF